jgi:hypothetical protein
MEIAKGTFEVNLQPLGLEAIPAESGLGRLSIDKTLHGDLQGSTQGQMLSARTLTQGSAGYVAVERVTATLQGRQGSFVLMHTGLMTRGTPSLSVVVVPDSGTGALAGITGQLHIEIIGGIHHYEFTYQMPPDA